MNRPLVVEFPVILVKMLSIIVALCVVILLGFVIIGLSGF